MGDAYPEIEKQEKLICKVIQEEEISFFRTLEQGIKELTKSLKTQNPVKKRELEGKAVFELYDTYGFPVDLTSLIAKENDMSIDVDGFNKFLEKQKDRSRNASAIETEDWIELNEGNSSCFIGYDQTEANVTVLRYRKIIIQR